MKVFNNVTDIVRDDMVEVLKKGSKVSIAAACFSMYAYKELKKQLEGIDELRFIFTSPTFVTEKAKKEKREFYIPRMDREQSLYGSEFEIKLRNENSCILPDGWTLDSFMQPHRSQPYNPNMANVFYRAGYIENWGQGIQKICDECYELGTELPVYELNGSFGYISRHSQMRL